MAVDDSLVGTGLTMLLEGQEVRGRITAVLPNKLVVELNVKQPASSYIGSEASVKLEDGRELIFDLGRNAYFNTLVVEVPLPERRRAASAQGGEGDASNERRRFFRFATDIDIEVLEMLSGGREYVRATGHTLNMSGGGMLVELNGLLAPGIYMFRLHLPSEELEIYGKVLPFKKGAGNGLAVEFVDLHEVERSKLIRFIFNKMRNIREGLDADKEKDPPRYWRRRERFYKPTKIRYW